MLQSRKLGNQKRFPGFRQILQVSGFCSIAEWERYRGGNMTAELKERIVDVAIEEFTLMGLKFTMNDIARQLGISKKTIYTIFDSKKDVRTEA